MYKYTGQIDPNNPSRREFVPGIPARDISDEEAKERGWEQALKDSPVYKHQGDQAMKPAGPPTPEPEGGKD